MNLSRILSKAQPTVIRKHIAFVSTMAGDPWGGSEELWSRTAVRLVKQGIPVVASVHGWPQLDRRVGDLSNAGVDVRPRPIRHSLIASVRRRISRNSQIVTDVENAFRRISPALVVISEGGAFPPIELVELCVMKGLPFAAVMHANFDNWWPKDDVAARYRKALPLALRCFFVSEANRELEEKQLGYEFENAEIVRNPVNIELDAPLPWPMIAANQELRIACVGRLIPPQKGQDILLEALANRRWAERNWRLTVYGEGPHRNGLERLIRKLNLSGRIDMPGQVAVEQIWRENHVLVIPSRFEGLPLTIVEAMLCGRPVIATNVGGNSEMIEDAVTGFLAETASVESLDKALERLWIDRDRLQQMGKVAAANIREFMPVDPVGTFAEKLIQLAALGPSLLRR
jgi:glycosyltransferase involved in cell wall biosynthesis